MNEMRELIEIIQNNYEPADLAEELSEIKDDMIDLLESAEMALRGTNEYTEARTYWIAHIRIALDNNHDYLSRNVTTMQDTIDSIRNTD